MGGSLGTVQHPPMRDFERELGRPAPALAGAVIGYQGFRQAQADGLRRLESPSVRIPLIVELGSGWRVAAPAGGYRWEALRRGFVAGLHSRFALVEPLGAAACLQVDLTPFGARRLLGVPMHELANRVIELDGLLGGDARRLAEQLEEAGSWPQRFEIVGAVLSRRLARAESASPGVVWAWRRLEETAGAVPMGSLACELGWSRKRLVARFRDQVGLTPKTAARVLRFARLVEQVRAQRAPDWARLAGDFGYFDQAHLIRDFREFSGITPASFSAILSADGSSVIAR